jgi:tetratricopeptide (TPR) repeat protein
MRLRKSAYIAQVIDGLKDNPEALTTCLYGLKCSEDGQAQLSPGSSADALPHLLEAHNAFQKVPSARYLLGITKSHIAVAYLALGKSSEAAEYARGAIEIVSRNPRFIRAEANAHISLAVALSETGRAEEAAIHYEAARRIYQGLPDSETYLCALERHMSSERAANRGEEKGSMGCALCVVAIVAAAVYLVVTIL